jgi:hypothetical protein
MSDEVFLNRVLPLIFLLIGIGLLVAAARYLTRTRTFLGKSAEAIGEVIALEEEPATEPGDPRTYRPVVSFPIDSTRRVRFKSVAHSNPPEYEVGDSVRVLYDPDRPGDARIRSFTSLWLPLTVLGGLGLIFTALGAGLLLGYVPT